MLFFLDTDGDSLYEARVRRLINDFTYSKSETDAIEPGNPDAWVAASAKEDAYDDIKYALEKLLEKYHSPFSREDNPDGFWK